MFIVHMTKTVLYRFVQYPLNSILALSQKEIKTQIEINSFQVFKNSTNCFSTIQLIKQIKLIEFNTKSIIKQLPMCKINMFKHTKKLNELLLNS